MYEIYIAWGMGVAGGTVSVMAWGHCVRKWGHVSTNSVETWIALGDLQASMVRRHNRAERRGDNETVQERPHVGGGTLRSESAWSS